MRTPIVFVVGLSIGAATQALLAQNQQPLVRQNHVGIAVPNVADALTWYTDKMGFHEVIRQMDQTGKLTSVYMQISKDTFIEIAEAKAGTTPGITHWGLQVDNIKDAVATFRQRGAMVSNPADKPSAYSGGYLANVTDLAGLRIELSEQPADSGKLRQASDKWTGKW
jgi:catechol 2,3-dioxygenase-like lactoylglutathione lyase family enzyme